MEKNGDQNKKTKSGKKPYVAGDGGRIQRQKTAMKVSVEQLEFYISKYDRQHVLSQLKADVLEQVPAEKKIEIYRSLFSLRDLLIVEYMAKKETYFMAEMFQLDLANFRNREFLNKVFHNYKKKINWADEEVCKDMFFILCELDNLEILSMIVKQKKAAEKYPLLAGAGMEICKLLLKVDTAHMPQDRIVEILLAAALAKNPQDRLQMLDAGGYQIGTKKLNGQTIIEVLEQYIRENTYQANKNGELMRTANRNTLLFLKKMKKEQENPVLKKVGGKKKAVILVVIIGILAVLIGATVAFTKGSGDADASATITADETSAAVQDALESVMSDYSSAE